MPMSDGHCRLPGHFFPAFRANKRPSSRLIPVQRSSNQHRAHSSQINVIRNLERAANQIHSGNRLHQDLDHIESVGNSGVIQHPEPFFRAANDPILLLHSDGVVRRTKCVRRTSLDFDEDQGCRTAIAAHQIDFTASFGAKIPVQDAITVFFEVICCDPLSLLADAQMGWSATPVEPLQATPNQSENKSERPEQTTADGLGRDRGFEASRCAPAFHNPYSRETRSRGTRYAIAASYGPG